MPPSGESTTLLLDAIHGVQDSVNSLRDTLTGALLEQRTHSAALTEIQERHKREDEAREQGAERRWAERHPIAVEIVRYAIGIIIVGVCIKLFPNVAKMFTNL